MLRVLLLAVVASLLLAPGAQAQLPGGVSSDNVEYVTNFARHADTSGAKLLDGYYYITTERDLSIYDVKDPLNPVLAGTTALATPGEPTFTEEDPDTNGRVLIVSNTDTMIYDVTDKAAPKLLSTLPGLDQHTMTCVLDCTWVYGSEGAIVDLRDPANPKLAGAWTDDVQPTPTSFHDVTEVSPGMLVTSTEPLLVLDARTDPVHPTVVGTAKTPGFLHANLWPQQGEDRFVLAGGEAMGPGCDASASATFMTLDASGFESSRTFSLISEFRMQSGVALDGRAPASTWCTHWFSPHPTFANGGLVAIAWYEQGTRFLRVDAAGKIEEIGYYLPTAGQASDVDWISDRVLYVADYLRGIDVVRFTGDIPPAFPAPDPGAPPAATHPTFERLVRIPARRSCKRRPLKVKIRRYDPDPVVRATLRLNGKRVRGLRIKRPPRRRFSVQVQVVTRSGFKTAGQRSYRRCR
jgi:hypothetical protein